MCAVWKGLLCVGCDSGATVEKRKTNEIGKKTKITIYGKKNKYTQTN